MKERFWIERKIVVCKKDHDCAACGKTIQKGLRALVESGRTEEDGFISSYFHVDPENKCYLDYLDAVMPPNSQAILEKVKDPNFHGQIDYNFWKVERI